MADMMVFIHPDCDSDDEMKAVMKKIQARMKRLWRKDQTSVDGAQASQNNDKVKPKNLNARLKRLLAAKKKFKSTACSNVLHPNLNQLTIASYGSDSSDSGCSAISTADGGANRRLDSECEKCGKESERLVRKQKRKKPDSSPDVPVKRGRPDGNRLSPELQQRHTWDYVAMDCEFVGVGPKKVSALGK